MTGHGREKPRREAERHAKGCAGCALSMMCGSRPKGGAERGEAFGASETRAIVLALAVPLLLFMTVLLTVNAYVEARWIGIVAAFGAVLAYFGAFGVAARVKRRRC